MENSEEKKKRLVDIIGEEYRGWEPGNVIFITAPTGAGKTYFIFYTLLEHIIRNKKRLLYLVNRRVLQKQLEEELGDKIEDKICGYFDSRMDTWKKYVTIKTYQSIEERLKSREIEKEISLLSQFDYAVYDECHYFYTDANFNTNTELSYDCLRRLFQPKIQIFMSATMKNVKDLILGRPAFFIPYYEEVQHEVSKYNKLKEYSIASDYSSIKVNVLNSMEYLVKHIRHSVKNEKVKWLIFVDSIDAGKMIRKKLMGEDQSFDAQENLILEKDVVFIDADFDKDRQAEKSVQQITKEKYANEKVVISTAVMDNGVSFHDIGLRNIVILADTEDTFIQMLGRKREDNKDINLYICKRDREHFRRRKEAVKRTLEYYSRYHKELEKGCERYLVWPLQPSEHGFFQKKMNVNAFVDLQYRMCDTGSGAALVVQKNIDTSLPNQVLPCSPCQQIVFSKNLKLFQDYEKMLNSQQRVLDEMLANPIIYQNMRKICYSVNGCLIANSFAVARCRNLREFYGKMMDELEKDENAFVKQQISWLGMGEVKVDFIIEKSEADKRRSYHERLEEAIRPILDTEMTDKENTEWKLTVKEELIYFLQKDEKYNINEAADIKKKDRVFSKDKFDRCMVQADLPYQMDKRKKEGKMVYKIIIK